LPAEVSVGIIANPASGRDIRRLVAGASVFGNADKGGMIYRLLAGLGATGVGRALMMPAADGVSTTLRRRLRARPAEKEGVAAPFPVLEELPMPLTGTARDSELAVELLRAEGVAALVVLGGDGTHRIVAKQCGEIPLCALSTGTNNSFPEMREATVAGLATGLVATGQVGGDGVLRRETALALELAGRERELALIEVAVTRDRFTGARALWRGDEVSELFVTFASPSAIGLCSVAGLLRPLARGATQGLHVRLAPSPADAELTLRVPLAPGLLVPVGIRGFDLIEMDQPVTVAAGEGCLALDGERELERRRGEPALVRLVPGPRTIDIDAVMLEAARRGLLDSDRPAFGSRPRAHNGQIRE
jgi:predicted polyphosphate/ATP-dependent NAD kinase